MVLVRISTLQPGMVWSERCGELWGGGWPDSGGDGRGGGDRDCRGDSYRIQYLTCCHFWGAVGTFPGNYLPS